MNHKRSQYQTPGHEPFWCDEWFDDDGCRHKDDGPAIMCKETEAWWIHGKLHREDGPAIVSGEYRAWWVNGVCKKIIFESGTIYEPSNT